MTCIKVHNEGVERQDAKVGEEKRKQDDLAHLLVFFLGVLAFISSNSLGAVSLPNVISSHMVLQQGMAVPIWGKAASGEKVIVTFRDQRQEIVADKEGQWRLKLRPLVAGGPDKLVVAGTNTIELEEVLVGEVWLGSGQSNMAGDINLYLNHDKALAKAVEAAPYPQIRIFKTGSPKWEVAGGPSLNVFSAQLFAFGQQLQPELKVPVGLLLGSESGTASGYWISEHAFAEDKACQDVLTRFRATFDENAVRAKYATDLAAWDIAATKARQAGKPEPQKPVRVRLPGEFNAGKIGTGYEMYVCPLIPYGIRGVLWDQGEAFTGIIGVDQYTLIGALIRSWRHDWNQGDFPFIYVQKPSGWGCAWDPNDPITSPRANFMKQPKTIPPGEIFLRKDGTFGMNGFYREAFVRIMNYPNTVMSTASDLDFTSSGHPDNKYGYGARAVKVALGHVYGRAVEICGPLYKSHHIEGDKVHIAFTHVGKGLAIGHSDSLQGFIIAGEDRQFVWADAKVEGDTVVVSSASVLKPAAVRYAWSKYIHWANLFNKDGLPALTFRTDNWPSE